MTASLSERNEIKAALRVGYLDALAQYGDLLRSYGVSLSEAAWRGEDATALTHVKQCRLVVIDAVETANRLKALDVDAPGKAAA